jgi:hypothetical protein
MGFSLTQPLVHSGFNFSIARDALEVDCVNDIFGDAGDDDDVGAAIVVVRMMWGLWGNLNR